MNLMFGAMSEGIYWLQGMLRTSAEFIIHEAGQIKSGIQDSNPDSGGFNKSIGFESGP